MQRIRLHCMIVAVAVATVALPVLAQSTAPAGPVAEVLPVLNLPAITAPAVVVTPPAAQPVTSAQPAEQTAGANQAAVAAVASDITAVPAAPAAPRTYSFGDSTLSILFLPNQVSGMKEALRTFEDSGKDAAVPAPVVETVTAPVAEVIEDPLVYPVFYLASIVYDDPKDWSLWISGYKITSRKNDTDVTVLSVTPDSATFLWTPSFSKAIRKRMSDKLFAPIDSVKSKLTAVQRASFDAGTGSVVFTLKPNQSFAVGYFKTFEGYVDGPTLTQLPVEVAATEAATPELVSFDGDGKPLSPAPSNPQAKPAQPAASANSSAPAPN